MLDHQRYCRSLGESIAPKIRELDLNPLLAGAVSEGCVTADGLVVHCISNDEPSRVKRLVSRLPLCRSRERVRPSN